MPLFKIAGLVILFSTSCCCGLAVSLKLKKRAAKLSELARALNGLAEYIRSDRSEIDRLVGICFKPQTVKAENGKFIIEKSFLDKEDISLLEEFFGAVGQKDSEGEYERTRLYTALTEKQCRSAEEKCNRLCRLYSGLGLLCGIFICVFLI